MADDKDPAEVVEEVPAPTTTETVEPAAPESTEVASPDAELSERIAALAQINGLSPEALSRFKSIEDAEAAVGLVDSVLLSSSRQQQQWGQQQPYDYMPQPFDPYAAVQPPAPTDELALNLADYDENDPTATNLKAMHKSLLDQKKLIGYLGGQLQQQQQQAFSIQQQQALSQAHQVLDEMGVERYGNSTTMTPLQRQNRENTIFTGLDLGNSRRSRGLPVPDFKVLFATMADRALFPTAPEREAKRTEALRAQAAKRAGTPSGTRTTAKGWKGKPQNHPEVLAKLREIKES